MATMVKVRRKDGQVSTVSEQRAAQLMQTGYYQYVTTPVRERSGGSFGYSSRDNVQIDSGVDWRDPFVAARRGVHTLANWDWMRWTKNVSDVVIGANPMSGDSILFPGDDRIFGGGVGSFEEYMAQQETGTTRTMSDAEKAEADKYISGSFGDDSEPIWDEATGKMIYRGAAAWWATEPETNADGSIAYDENGDQIFRFYKAKMGEWNIENDSEMKGFTDTQMEYISNEYTNMAYDPHQERATGAYPGSDRPPVGPGGGSGGRGGPKYVGPMREVTEDIVKAMLTALTGTEDESLVQEYADLYEKSHRQQYDVSMTGGTDVDPMQVILGRVRGQADYKKIHALRSESESETRWISDRAAKLTSLGMSSKDADDRAMWLAQTGTNIADIGIDQAMVSKGQSSIGMLNKISKAAAQVARRI